MSKQRFTGEWPSEAAMREYPNWDSALDEEGEEGQDETTLRPGDEQAFIGLDTICTAAVATTPDGTELTAILRGAMMFGLSEASSEGIDGVHVFRDGVRYDIELFPRAWRNEKGTPYPVQFFDPTLLPLRLVSVLPIEEDDPTRHELMLMGDGSLLLGDNARKATFQYPPWYRPSDVPAGDRSHLLGRRTSTNYTVQKGERVLTGKSDRVVTKGERGTLHIAFSASLNDMSLQGEEIDDERSLAVRSVTSTFQGVTRMFAPDGEGSLRIPPDVFGDQELLLRTAPLAEGWQAMSPILSAIGARIQNTLFAVEAREAAPEHPGRIAWRIRIESGGQVLQHLWLDVETRRVLTMRTTAPGTTIEHIDIFDVQ